MREDFELINETEELCAHQREEGKNTRCGKLGSRDVGKERNRYRKSVTLQHSLVH